MTERRIGPFILGAQIGAGGMGVVYKATYTETGKEVALKVLPPGLVGDAKLLKRFEREIDILKRLTHPNIVKYYGGGTHEGQRWYAMEFIDGGSLYDILKKKKKLSWDQAVQVGRQLCAALEHAHNAGIIHRDLKPANLFVTKKGRIKLGDFGIARDTEATALTAAGKTVGTYAYMAPEQIQGNAPISRKTDIYAAGCLMYEVLTGETPFVSENPAEMLMMHLNEDPYNVREKGVDCPAALDALIERMLDKNPDERPYDALAVQTELAEILHRGNEVSEPVSAQALMSSGSKPVAVDPATGEIKLKKKKKKKDNSAFYEQTWFLGTCLAALIALGVWLAIGSGEDDLYLQAKEAMNSADTVAMYDARRLYLRPYLEQFPEGKYVAEVQSWLDNAEVAMLEAQVENRAKLKRDGRNNWEIAFLKAIAVERDEDRNSLEAIDLFQKFIGDMDAAASATSEEAPNTDSAATATDTNSEDAAISEPKYWKVLAGKHLTNIKAQVLEKTELDKLVRQYMIALNDKLKSADPGSAESAAFQRFRDVFRGEDRLEPWREYALLRLKGTEAKMPGDG